MDGGRKALEIGHFYDIHARALSCIASSIG